MAENPRRNFPNNYQDLMKFGIENSSNDPERPIEPMDPERRQWLEDALSSMTINVTEDMLKSIETLQKKAESEVDVIEHERALDNLLNYVDNLDFANDFHKIGGFSVLPHELQSPFPTLRLKTANLLAELVQNNPYCQQAASEFGLISPLIDMLDNDPEPDVRIKALYGLSCLIRHNPSALNEFIALDGFSYLMRAMQSNIQKLRIKSSFLISCLCEQQPSIKDTLSNMGFVEQLIALVQEEHDTTHEHLLSALNCLVTGHQPSIDECKRVELNLKEILEQRVALIEGQEESLEEMEYCTQLLNTVFNNSHVKSTPPR